MKNIQNLNEIFNIDSMPELDTNLPMIPAPMNTSKEADQEDDYQLARQTMRKLLVKGEDTLDELINLSKNSEHPRTYEVAGQMIKTLSDVSKDLLNLQKQVKDLKQDEGGSNAPIGTQNNIMFAGSTDELMKLLNSKTNGNVIDQ
jgi:hypothetical protein